MALLPLRCILPEFIFAALQDAACLNAAGLDYVESVNGITYEHKATGASLFTDPNGHDSCINVWVDETGTVTEIDWSTYTG